jgi:flagellar hook-associated protein 2
VSATVNPTSATAPLSVSGLASGLNTSQIISSLLAVEREPVTRLTNEQTTVEGQETELQSIQSSLTQLSFGAQELGSPVLFNTTEAVSSSDPVQVSATTSTGAAVGGYEVEVTQLANAGQRTFTFKSPAAAEAITIDGQEFEIPAGGSIQSFVSKINSDSKATVYAAAPNSDTLILSTRATGATGPGFIAVSDPGGALVEQSSLAKEGRDAEYSVDGVSGSSTSNTVEDAIPGVALSFKALTTDPVTVVVEPPTPNKSAIVSQVQSFISLYNSTVTAIETQLATKPPSDPVSTAEMQTGTLFGDPELMGLLNGMRQSIYNAQSGLPKEMSSLADIGVSTGAPTGTGVVSKSAIEGQLKLNTEELESAIESNPAGVEQMLHRWSTAFQTLVNAEALPGGNLEERIDSDGAQVTQLTNSIAAMNEAIAVHQKSLEAQFAAMEAAVSRNQSQSSYLSAQLASLNGESSSSSSSSGAATSL